MTVKESTASKHDDFVKICAAASLGNATAEDLLQLERHVLVCLNCRQAYYENVSAAALQFASVARDEKLSLKEANECLDSEHFMRRWFERAEREGIAFSDEVRRPVDRNNGTLSHLRLGLLRHQLGASLAGAALLMLALSASYFHWKISSSSLRLDSGYQDMYSTLVEKHVKDLETTNHTLGADLDRLKRELANAETRFSASVTDDKKTITQERKDFTLQRDFLRAQSEQLQAQLILSQKELAQLQSEANNGQNEAEEQRKQAGDLKDALIDAQAELRELNVKLNDESAAISRERELLSMGRDVTDLMGARNLHILDVADTDTQGNTRPAFGRIFFTEGKSLIFYAYDLNEAKMQKANYQYQVWAKKEGFNKSVRRLGIFYSDDKSQNRWVFKCDDPKVVNEIDSVFVTLGRPNSNSNRPEGSPLMFAYLHGAPNHP